MSNPSTLKNGHAPEWRIRSRRFGLPAKDLRALQKWRREAESQAEALGLGGADAGLRHFAAFTLLAEVYAANNRLAAGGLTPEQQRVEWAAIEQASTRAVAIMAPLRPRQPAKPPDPHRQLPGESWEAWTERLNAQVLGQQQRPVFTEEVVTREILDAERQLAAAVTPEERATAEEALAAARAAVSTPSSAAVGAPSPADEPGRPRGPPWRFGRVLR
jgi:hypothetical protein